MFSFWQKVSSMLSSFWPKKEPVRIPITKETRENFLNSMPIVFFVICGTCMIGAVVIYVLIKRERTKEKEIRRHITEKEFLTKTISRCDPLFSPKGAAFAIEADSHREAVPGEIDEFCEPICPKREKTVLSIKDSSETLKVEMASLGNTDLNAAVTIHSSFQETPIGTSNKLEAERIYEKSLPVSTRQNSDSPKKAKKDNNKATMAAKFTSLRKNSGKAAATTNRSPKEHLATISGKNKNDESKHPKRTLTKFPKRQEPMASDKTWNNMAVRCDLKASDKKRVPISFRSKSLSPRKIENNDLNQLATTDIPMDGNPLDLENANRLDRFHVENFLDSSGTNATKAEIIPDYINLDKIHGSISEKGRAVQSNNIDISKETRQGFPKKRSLSSCVFSRVGKSPKAAKVLCKVPPTPRDIILDKNNGSIAERGRAVQFNNLDVSKETLQRSPCYGSPRMKKPIEVSEGSSNLESEKKLNNNKISGGSVETSFSDVAFGSLRYYSKSLVSKLAVPNNQNCTECLPVISKIPVYVSPLRRTLSDGVSVESEAHQKNPERVIGAKEFEKNLVQGQEGFIISKLPVHVPTLHRKSSGDFF